MAYLVTNKNNYRIEVIDNGKKVLGIEYSFNKYGKETAKKLAEYSLKTLERLNNWYEERDDCIVLYVWNKKNQVNDEVLISKQDFDKVKQHYWRIDKYGYVTSNALCHDVKDCRLHRFITNCPKEKVVDHKNGIKTDNRRCNLRIITDKENRRNRQSNKNTTTEFPGVRNCKPNRNGYETRWFDEDGKPHTKYFATSIYGDEESALLEAVYYREQMEIETNYQSARYREEQKLIQVLYNISLNKSE